MRIEDDRRRAGAELAGVNLSRALLRVTSLARANLTRANLSGADLSGANLSGARLQGARLKHAQLGGVDLFLANLTQVDLRAADLREVDLLRAFLYRANLAEARIRKAKDAVLIEAQLQRSDLIHAQMQSADLTSARLRGSKMRGVNLVGAVLVNADLRAADLRDAELIGANLSGAVLRGADLRGANLSSSILNRTDLRDADLTGCHVYGMSAWDLRLGGTKQYDLSITSADDPVIRVDSLEVAQFIYLLLNNARIKGVIETINSKAVLILGRFTPRRKRVLDMIRAYLRTKDTVPILFDFEKPSSRNLLETVSMLAHMSKLVLADLTDASFVRLELPLVLRQLRIPVQPVLLARHAEPAMLARLRRKYPRSLLPTLRYQSGAGLLRELDQLLADPRLGFRRSR